MARVAATKLLLARNCRLDHFGRLPSLMSTRSLHSYTHMMQTSMVQESTAPSSLRRTYDVDGWAPMELTASTEDLAAIKEYVAKRVKYDHPGNIFGDDGELRAVHGYDYDWHPDFMSRLASRALSLIGCESVYVYQFRVNSKSPSKTTGKWDLHRDFDFWHGMDGMPTTRAVAFHVLVNDHTDNNGPVVFVDGSHRMQTQVNAKNDANWEAGFEEGSFKYTIDERMIGNASCTAMTGKAGQIAAMHPLTWHLSSPNLCSQPRVLMSVIFNDVTNLPVQPSGTTRRPEFIVGDPKQIWTKAKEDSQFPDQPSTAEYDLAKSSRFLASEKYSFTSE